MHDHNKHTCKVIRIQISFTGLFHDYLEIAALQKLGQIDGKCEKRYHDNTFKSKFVTVC